MERNNFDNFENLFHVPNVYDRKKEYFVLTYYAL